MNWSEMEMHFSRARVGRYHAARRGDEAKTISDYTSNVLLAEAMVPMLNILEIALRNSIHSRLSVLYQRADWWEAWRSIPTFHWQNKAIAHAKAKLARRRELQTPDKVLAEMSFGFWSSLFNAPFQAILWKDLRLAFSRSPKTLRQRHNVASALNQIRNLRNRVFHHEPLLWLTPTLCVQHRVGITVIDWIDPQLGLWLNRYDRLPAIWSSWQAT